MSIKLVFEVKGHTCRLRASLVIEISNLHESTVSLAATRFIEVTIVLREVNYE